MTLMDNRFGAEVVSKKGKIFKFDDASCLVNFVQSAELAEDNYAHCLITDFASPEVLIDAKTAFYISSDRLRTPMAGNVAAFQNNSDAEQFNNEWKGRPLSWEELIKK
jgi:copper chaperone NosL